ncbi:SRPBCC family protein [Leifsonia shinshuensis]
MAEHVSSVDITAPPETVFAYLVTPAGLTAWMGQYAVLDPRPGGEFTADIAGSPIRGEFLEVDEPHRVVISWGVAGSSDLPPGASTVTFTLTPLGSGTRVQVRHTDLPEPRVAGHRAGWAHFLPRLAVAASGGDPGADDWRPLTPVP